MAFALSWSIVWFGAFLARLRWTWLFPAVGLALLALFYDVGPGWRLAASSLFFLYLVKAAVLSASRAPLERWDRLLYFTAWPGMDPERLALREEPKEGTGKRFGVGLTIALFGAAGLVALTVAFPLFTPKAVGWLGIVALLTTVHLGFSQVLTAALHLSGRPVKPLFDSPLASRTLSDFWTKRWNLAFVEMNRRLFMPLFGRGFGIRGAVFGTFFVSGLLHEMAISYPAGAGYGGPTLYFVLQGCALPLERKLKIRSRLLTWIVVLVPLPLLFHGPFRETLVVPLFEWLHRRWSSQPLESYVNALIWVLGGMQLCVLGASAQVPSRLRWKEELARLSPFNRKLMWTYGIFIVTTIVSFAVLTLLLRESFLKGERAALSLAIFMSIFWILRLLFDAVYFKSEDWPPGEDLKAGHALLNALFVFLVLTYGAVGVWGLTIH